MRYEKREIIKTLMFMLAVVGCLLFTLVVGLSLICPLATFFYMVLVWVLIENFGREEGEDEDEDE